LQNALKPIQSKLEATFLSIAKGSDPYPLPGRPIRNLVARCFIKLYTRGETRTLFDTLQALIKVAGETKLSDKEKDVRVCVILFEVRVDMC